MKLLKENNDAVFIFWFEDSLRQAEHYLVEMEIAGADLLTTREVSHSALIKNKKIFFAEHYPLRNKEQEFFDSLNLAETTVLSALDEPLFINFGSDKIAGLLKQLGLKENESIQHQMISAAIKNAQEKLERKIITEHSASSQAGWFQKNIAAEN